MLEVTNSGDGLGTRLCNVVQFYTLVCNMKMAKMYYFMLKEPGNETGSSHDNTYTIVSTGKVPCIQLQGYCS